MTQFLGRKLLLCSSSCWAATAVLCSRPHWEPEPQRPEGNRACPSKKKKNDLLLHDQVLQTLRLPKAQTHHDCPQTIGHPLSAGNAAAQLLRRSSLHVPATLRRRVTHQKAHFLRNLQ